jgi:hypothetical protein
VIISAARKNSHPYIVHRLSHTDFLDMKGLSKRIMKNRTKNTDGEKVNWLNFKWLRFDKQQPYVIGYKYSVTDVEFMYVVVCPARGRPHSLKNVEMKPLYYTRLPISSAKKKDLMSLVTSGVIPQEYVHFHEQLPSSIHTRDSLPEPSADEP